MIEETSLARKDRWFNSKVNVFCVKNKQRIRHISGYTTDKRLISLLYLWNTCTRNCTEEPGAISGETDKGQEETIHKRKDNK